MSLAEAIDDDPSVAQPGVATSESTRSKQAPWVWATLACLLLGTSGVIRTVQDLRHIEETNYVETCPFPLKDLPQKLGAWRLKDGGEQALDPLTMRITGGTEHLLRTYVDELTGVSLGVLVLFGPAEPVLPHVPEICYPANGFSGAQDSMNRTIVYGPKDSQGHAPEAVFRSSVYVKPGGLLVRREEAYHSFRLEGNWSPDAGAGRKLPRRNPGVFKVQIQRSVLPGENREHDNPIEQFLSILIPEIEQRIASASANRPVAGNLK
jgi:hypothetical protein